MTSFYRCEKCGNHASVDGARMTPTEAVYCRFCPDLTEMHLVDGPAPTMRIGGRQCGKRTLTIETLHEAVEKLRQQDIPQGFTALFPASCATACLEEFGGRLVPCARPTLEAYDEIVDHNEGQGLIILVEKE